MSTTTAAAGLLCRCLKVSVAQAEAAIDFGGAETVRDVSKQTGAGRACMACHCRIKELLRQKAAEREALTTCADESHGYAAAGVGEAPMATVIEAA